MITFQRGKNIKETLEIGRLCKAWKIEAIEIGLRDKDIPLDPYWTYREVFTDSELHIILGSLQEKKYPWSILKKRNPDFFGNSSNKDRDMFKRIIFIVSTRELTTGRRVAYRIIQGEDVAYEGKVYRMPKIIRTRYHEFPER